MAPRSIAGMLLGLLLGAVLVLAALLARSSPREAGVDRSLELSRLAVTVAGRASPVTLDGAPAREVAAARAFEPQAEEAPRPRLVVEVTSEGSGSPARPLPGVEIHAEGFHAALGTTDDAGRLEVVLPTGTEGVRLRAEASAHARATAYVEDGVARARLVLRQVALLVGRVRHADGRPAVESRVAAFTEEEARGLAMPEGPRRQGPATPSTTTDEQGRYALEVVAGPWRLASSSLAGSERPWGWTEVLEAVEGAETRVDDLVLPPLAADRTLHVRVVDRRHGAVPGARIDYALRDAEKRSARGFATADVEGRFVVVGRPGDTFEVGARGSAPGFAEARATGRVGGPALELVLEPAPILELVLRAPGGTAPAEEFRWRLGRADVAGDEWLEFGTYAAGGRGVCAATWPTGADVLEILAALGYAGERVPLPSPPGPGERARVEVHLRAGLRVAGRVRGAAGGLAAPLVRARRITDVASGADPDTWPRRGTATTRVGEDGEFRLGLREPGTYLIGVTGERRAPLVVGPFEILELPGLVDLDLELAPGRPDAAGEARE